MKTIPVTVEISAEDVDTLSHIAEMENDGSFQKEFSERVLRSARDSSDELRKTLNEVDSFNPFCMDKTFIQHEG